MDLFRLVDAGRQFFDLNGATLTAGKIHTYTAGTTIAKTTFEDVDGTTPHANPIILTASGTIPAELWGSTGAYKLVITDADGNAINTIDDIMGINDVAAASVNSEWVTFEGTPTQTSGTTFTVAEDQTAIFHIGRRVRATDGTGDKYGVITLSAFSSVTTVTCLWDSDSIDATLSSVSYALAAYVNPSTPSPMQITSCRAYLSSDQVSFPEGTTTLVELNVVEWDHGSDWDTSNNHFVVPDDGIYLIEAAVLWASNIVLDPSAVAAYAFVNPLGGGSFSLAATLFGFKTGSSGFVNTPIGSAILDLKATDQLALYAHVTSFNNGSGVVNSGNKNTHMSIVRLS